MHKLLVLRRTELHGEEFEGVGEEKDSLGEETR